jgi:amino acid transporter
MNLHKHLKLQIISISLSLLFFFQKASAALLQPDASKDIKDRAENLGGSAGFNTRQGLGEVVAIIIQAFLGLLGIIFIILIISAGFNWMTAGGEEEKVRKAKSTITNAVIGLIIIVASYAITYFVFNVLPGAIGGGGPVYNYPG